MVTSMEYMDGQKDGQIVSRVLSSQFILYIMTFGEKANNRAKKRVFDSKVYALVFEEAACDCVVGSKRTHMGGYVEQDPAQSPNGQPIEEDAHTVKDSDLMLS